MERIRSSIRVGLMVLLQGLASLAAAQGLPVPPPASKASAAANASSRNLAPGFAALQPGAKLVLLSPDVELFSISGGGVLEPKADWTESAHGHLRRALDNVMSNRKVSVLRLTDKDEDDFNELSSLHAAVAGAISLHHLSAEMFRLPTKNGQLDWSLGEAVKPLRELTQGDYALFVWMRDSYASAERKAAMVAMAMLGVGIVGGMQIGYASLVDLRNGQVLWFNRLIRGSGDLREAASAEETLKTLMTQFPAAQ